MIKNIFHSILILSLFVSTPLFAQEDVSEPVNIPETNKAFENNDALMPEFEIDEYVEYGQDILLDASLSTPGAPSLGQVSYSWDFGDGTRPQWGEKVRHAYKEPGVYEVVLRMKQGLTTEEKKQSVYVYDTKMVLITDKIDTLDQIADQAALEGIWLMVIPFETGSTEFNTSKRFIQDIQSNIAFLREAETFIVYDNSLQALQAFAQYWQETDPEKVFDPQEKTWIHLYDGSFNKAIQVFKPIFNILQPNRILLTRSNVFIPLFKDGVISDDVLRSRGIEFQEVTESILSTSPIFVISNITNLFITKGISVDVIYLLFAVPFIAFVIAFFRQFVGVATLGVYAPLMLTLSFMVLGLKFGFIVFIAVMIVSYLIRTIFERIELMYIPKVALLLSVLSLSFFFILGGAIYINPGTDLALSIFPMLVMATLSEKFLSAQSESGMKSAFIAMAETVIISMIAYGVVEWDFVRTMVLARPEWMIVPMAGIFWLGRFTGLRVSEYLKFRAFYKEDAAEEE